MSDRLKQTAAAIQKYLNKRSDSANELNDIYLHQSEEGVITLITTTRRLPIRTPAIHPLFLSGIPYHAQPWDQEIAETVPHWQFQPEIPPTIAPYLQSSSLRPLRERNHLTDFSNAEFLHYYQELLAWFQHLDPILIKERAQNINDDTYTQWLENSTPATIPPQKVQAYRILTDYALPNIPSIEEVKRQVLLAIKTSQGHPIDKYILNIDRTTNNWPTLKTIIQARSRLPEQYAAIHRSTTDSMSSILYTFLAPSNIQHAVMPNYLNGSDDYIAHQLLTTEAIRYRLVEVLNSLPAH